LANRAQFVCTVYKFYSERSGVWTGISFTVFFAVSGYTYLGDSGTDPRAILRYGTHPGCIFSRFGGGIPGISKIENFGLIIKYKKRQVAALHVN